MYKDSLTNEGNTACCNEALYLKFAKKWDSSSSVLAILYTYDTVNYDSGILNMKYRKVVYSKNVRKHNARIQNKQHCMPILLLKSYKQQAATNKL